MQALKYFVNTILASLLMLVASQAAAQNVDARLSTRQAYVGQPIVLQIAIQNASDYDQPNIPNIDGCEIRSAGPPSVSSQTTIINGRRSDSRTVIMQFLITPTRSGDFELPPFSFNVDGRKFTTEAMRFSATVSETGDLLFVEVEGDQKRVYVGQQLDLKLKIWIKPFVDRERGIQLSEANMWRMVSSNTEWGNFSEAITSLANNNQRPGGAEVERETADGKQETYYLYEITASINPKRPGQLEADDVRIAVDYPTAIGEQRDPFGSMLDGGGLGGSSLRKFFEDDFFSSPFSTQLAITGTRPISAKASVDAAEVIPVPTAGRPADYQGAVGSYQIVTQASPTEVSAGDPIMLQIGIVGSGPMELVQAPPLTELEMLTTDFKVEDQSLAGFVRQDTKVFPTKIRPRRAGITSIPPIPFSFFDPETESFQTVYSEAIDIQVDEAESLAMDSIISSANEPGFNTNNPNDLANDQESLKPLLENATSLSVLDSHPPQSESKTWLWMVVLPPAVWFMTWMWLIRSQANTSIRSFPDYFRSAKVQCERRIKTATESSQILDAIAQYIRARTNLPQSSTTQEAIGQLRLRGLYSLASEFEAFVDSLSRNPLLDPSSSIEQSATPDELSRYRAEALAMVERLTQAFAQHQNPRISRQKKSLNQATMLALIAFGFSLLSQDNLLAATTDSSSPLNRSNQEAIFAEANLLYEQATELSSSDAAEALAAFEQAAGKYQQLADSGITNSQLYFNLGNAYLSSQQLGRSIAAYHQAQRLAPDNRQVRINLNYAKSLVKQPSSDVSVNPNGWWTQQLQVTNRILETNLSRDTIRWALGLSSICFWGLLTLGIVVPKLPAKRLAFIPLIILVAAASTYLPSNFASPEMPQGILVESAVVLRSGDGQQFSEVATIGSADGHLVQILAKRAGWTQIRSRTGDVGWIPDSAYLNL